MSKILSNKSSVDLDYPICRPSLDLDFTQEELDPRITFTRGSIGTRVNRNGLIETISANQPRFDYGPISGECRGLLIEESRQNYELYSGDPTQWASNQNMTLTGNSIRLPTGETSTKVEWRGTDSGANAKILRPSPSGSGVAAGETWTFSIFLRAGTEQTIHLTIQNQTGGDSVGSVFNLVTGQFSGSITGTNAANGSRGVQSFGNGWYRVWLTNTYQSISSGQQTFVRLRSNTTSMQMTTSFSVWGAQLEKGEFPTSYIPTTASTVTRSSDLARMTGTNFSSWYNQSEGTVLSSVNFIENLSSSNFASNNILYGINDNSSNNRITLFGLNGFKSIVSRYVISGFTYPSSTVVISSRQNKFAHSFKTTGISLVGNGGTPSATQTVTNTYPTVNRLEIGNQIGTFYLNGTISRLTYYPRALKPNQLQFLTA